MVRSATFLGLIGVWISLLSLSFFESEFGHLLVPPKGFPEIPFPDDNRFSDARWLLGRKLFYDPIMSLDSSISCASCHMAQFAFSDTVAMSLGAAKAIGTRNAPTLTNVVYNPSFTRDGGVPTLEMQILVPIQEHNEFNFNIVLIAERMMKDPTYVQMSNEAYGKNPDHFVITRALGCFERTIISGNSRYDKYAFQDQKGELNEVELKGMGLFFSSEMGCSGCHSGFNFTDYSFKNNGLYIAYQDSGRKRLTDLEIDQSLFKVPTLRNVGLTAPYMHDGSLQTLEQVLEHYSSGGKPHANKSELIKPLNLSSKQKEQLVAFLNTLTDYEFINRAEFKPEGY
ncbi:MAG: cytochrome-c peroxidase [Flavobacteriales bacterium]|nr:cytochrome-c peroxidase [Flavobacteriales bacterium]